jgi:hypothetical protein
MEDSSKIERIDIMLKELSDADSSVVIETLKRLLEVEISTDDAIVEIY